MSRKRRSKLEFTGDFQSDFVKLINALEDFNRKIARERERARSQSERAAKKLEADIQFFTAKFGPSFVEDLRASGIPVTMNDQGVVHVERTFDEADYEPVKYADPRNN